MPRSWKAGIAFGLALLPAILAVSARGADPLPELWVSANTQGVLEPCGCVTGQGGGLSRRATAIVQLRAGGRGLLVDAGNLVSRLSPDAEILDTGRQLLLALGYRAGVIGPAELELGFAVLSKAPAMGRLPLIASNVTGPAGESLGPRSITVGMIELFAVVAPEWVPRGFRAEPAADALLGPVAAARAAGRRVVVIGHLPAAEARALLTAVPGVETLIAAPLPPGPPERVGDSWLVSAPASGRELMRLTLPGPGDPTRRGVPIPHAMERDPSVARRLLVFYESRRVTLNRAPAPAAGTPNFLTQAQEQCGGCHLDQQRHWAASKHALAWHTLREKQADTRKDCISCHTTSPPGTASAVALGVGCAACHGDGTAHARAPQTAGLIIRKPAATVCARCHTPDASPQFDHPKYLPAVRH
jgi:hypothetical protein